MKWRKMYVSEWYDASSYQDYRKVGKYLNSSVVMVAEIMQ
jgi:hypothetical protein